MEIVLASHSNLAKGMYDTLSLIMGKQDNVHYITAYLQDDSNFSDQLRKTIEPISEQQIIFLSDVMGGSVNNELVEFVTQNPNYILVAGMNLPFVLELATFASSSSDLTISDIQNKLADLIAVGRQGLQVVKLKDSTEEDDF